MTTWSPPELNAVFGCTLGEVDATEIEALVTDEVEETNLLDFKTDYHPHEKSTGWTERHELAKDVASFATRKVESSSSALPNETRRLRLPNHSSNRQVK